MENLFRCVRTLSLFCCIFCISSAEEIYVLSKTVGSSVKLHCNTTFPSHVTQVLWKRNDNPLLSFLPGNPIYMSSEASRLKINMSVSKNERYALIIESAQKEHEGNYTCEVTVPIGSWPKKWELRITDKEQQPAGKINMKIMIPVTCACSLVFMMIFTFVILPRVCKKPPENIESPIAEERTEDIYENCLEMNMRPRHICSQPSHYNTMAH